MWASSSTEGSPSVCTHVRACAKYRACRVVPAPADLPATSLLSEDSQEGELGACHLWRSVPPLLLNTGTGNEQAWSGAC